MKCPLCFCEMEKYKLGEISFQICFDGCRSLWVNWEELVGHRTESDNSITQFPDLISHGHRDESQRIPINCTVCGKTMRMHEVFGETGPVIDECYDCLSFFIDGHRFKNMSPNIAKEWMGHEVYEKLVDNIPSYTEQQLEGDLPIIRRDALLILSELLTLLIRQQKRSTPKS